MTFDRLSEGAVAVVAGGAAGIGLATAMRFARRGLKVCVADLGRDRLDAAAETLAAEAPGGAAEVMATEADVNRLEDLRRLEAAVAERFGGADVLMNNAGVQPGSGVFGPAENWE